MATAKERRERREREREERMDPADALATLQASSTLQDLLKAVKKGHYYNQSIPESVARARKYLLERKALDYQFKGLPDGTSRAEIANNDRENQRYRTNLTDMKIDVYNALSALKRDIGITEDYLRNTRSAALAAGANREDRQSLLDGALAPAHVHRAELEDLMAVLDMVLVDLDKTGFHVKNVTVLFGEHADRSR